MPRFVDVSSGGTHHRFSVFAQVVHANGFLIVRGYNKLYVFPRTARVAYGSADVTDQLPATTMTSTLASAIAAHGTKFNNGVFAAGGGTSRNRLDITWASLKDPWQIAPDYVVADGYVTPSLIGHRPPPQPPPWRPCPMDDCSGYWYYYQYYYPVPYYPHESPPEYSPCQCAVSSDARRPQSERSVAALKSLQQAIQAHSIPDDAIDANIDPGIPPHARALAREAMQRLPANARQHVAGIAADGTFFANRIEDYEAHQREGHWQQIDGNVWRKPNGEIVTVADFWADEKAAAASRRTQAVSCPPPGSSTTGAYVRGYVCNSTSGQFTASVDASSVGGAEGGSWCLNYGDTGYLLVGALSNATNDAAEGGLQWSPANGNYAMYVTDAKGLNQQIPASYSFPPGPFTMWFTNNASNWSLTVAGSGGTKTWTYTQATTVQAGSSWTYKQGTMIAQKPPHLTDGSFFGVDSGSGNPLFYWSAASGYDTYPNDPTRAIKVGNAYGINLHS